MKRLLETIRAYIANEEPNYAAPLGFRVKRLVSWVWFFFGTFYLLPLAMLFSLGKKLGIKEASRLLKILTLWKHDAFPFPQKPGHLPDLDI